MTFSTAQENSSNSLLSGNANFYFMVRLQGRGRHWYAWTDPDGSWLFPNGIYGYDLLYPDAVYLFTIPKRWLHILFTKGGLDLDNDGVVGVDDQKYLEIRIKYQQDVAKDIQKYTAEIQGKRTEFQSQMEAAKKSLEQAQIRLQTSSQFQQKSQDKFQKYNALYRAALQELISVTGAQMAPPQQQAEQRGEEAIST